MLNEKNIYERLTKHINNIEIAFSENMLNYIYIVCDTIDKNAIVNNIKDMFKDDETLDITIFNNKATKSNIVLVSLE